MIDVGGHRLYIECTGSGGPAVILQAGLGASSSSWAGIAPTIAATTTVCAYDRAGHGRSDEAGPQDGIALATDLHTLLERAGVPGPYVLVGHSSGGPYVRVFAARYPDQIAGMVLLDSQPDDAFTALPAYPGFYSTFRTVATLSPSLARIGLLGPLLGLSADESTAAAARGARDEFLALPTVLTQASALISLGDRPLIVVTAAAEAGSRLGGRPGQPAPPVDRERPSGPGRRHSQLAYLRGRRRSIEPGDPRRPGGGPHRRCKAMTVPAAVLAAILFVGMAAFQASLALGAPFGAHVLGGRHAGSLPNRLRLASAIATAILVGAALVVLGRAGAMGWPTGANGLLAPATWAIAAFLVLNTLGNRASKSRLERTVFAATTAVLALLSTYVALSYGFNVIA